MSRMSVIEAFVDGLGNFIGVVLVTPVAFLAAYARKRFQTVDENTDRVGHIEEHLGLDEESDKPRLKKHEEQLDELKQLNRQQHRALYGDEDNDHDGGMVGEIHEIHGQVHHDQE